MVKNAADFALEEAENRLKLAFGGWIGSKLRKKRKNLEKLLDKWSLSAILCPCSLLTEVMSWTRLKQKLKNLHKVA